MPACPWEIRTCQVVEATTICLLDLLGAVSRDIVAAALASRFTPHERVAQAAAPRKLQCQCAKREQGSDAWLHLHHDCSNGSALMLALKVLLSQSTCSKIALQKGCGSGTRCKECEVKVGRRCESRRCGRGSKIHSSSHSSGSGTNSSDVQSRLLGQGRTQGIASSVKCYALTMLT